MKEHPNFLTCPAFPESNSPKKSEHFSAPTPSSDEQKPKQDKRKLKMPRRRFVIITALLLAILGTAFLIVPPGVALVRAGLAANDARTAVANLQENLRQGDFEAAQTEASRARVAFETMDSSLSGVGFWRDVPYLGTQVRAVQEAAAVSVNSMDGVDDLLEATSAIFDAAAAGSGAKGSLAVPLSPTDRLKDMTPAQKKDALQALYQSLPKIRLARDKLDIAMALWQNISQDQLASPIRNALKPLADNLPVMQRSLDQVVPLIETLVPLAGYPAPQRYLIALQNADELRPGGGFIGSIVLAEVDAGDIKQFIFSDVYNVDHPAAAGWKEVPPKPLADHLAVKQWFMRDANWSPDFPTSAERVLDFFERETAIGTGKPAPNMTSYVAIEPGFFKSLLRLTGPIVVRGKTFTEDNFFDILQYEVEIGFGSEGIAVEDRKALMGELGQMLLAKIQALPASKWPEVLNLVTAAMRQKQILVYSRDRSLQATLDRYEYTGRAKPTQGDFVWVVDANLAALKTDGVMAKSVTYKLDASDPQKPVATVTLKYKNNAPGFSWRYTRYRSYTRVYVPEGSTFISSSGAMKGDLNQTGGKFVPGNVDVMKELGKTVYGAFWSIEPGKTGTLSFTYSLPSSIIGSDGTYRLDWPKQPGADHTELNVSAKMPRKVLNAEPPEPQSKWGDAIYDAQADTLVDQIFTVKY